MTLCHSSLRSGIQGIESVHPSQSGIEFIAKSPGFRVYARNDIYARILLLLKIYVELGLIPAPVIDKLEPLDE